MGRLALARERYAGQVEDFDLALTTLEVRRKLRTKVPEWYDVLSLRYPLRVSGEQCSSAETARYKAAVARAACDAGRVSVNGKPAKASVKATEVRSEPLSLRTGKSLPRGTTWCWPITMPPPTAR